MVAVTAAYSVRQWGLYSAVGSAKQLDDVLAGPKEHLAAGASVGGLVGKKEPQMVA